MPVDRGQIAETIVRQVRQAVAPAVQNAVDVVLYRQEGLRRRIAIVDGDTVREKPRHRFKKPWTAALHALTSAWTPFAISKVTAMPSPSPSENDTRMPSGTCWF